MPQSGTSYRKRYPALGRVMATGLLALMAQGARAEGVLSLNTPLPEDIRSRIASERVINGADAVPSAGHSLIYAASLGDDPAAMVADLPEGALLVVGDCRAADALAEAGPIAAQIAVAEDPANCDQAALAQAFVDAAALAPDQRVQTLTKGGYRVLGSAAPVRIAAPSGAGGLVISALPVETVTATDNSVILASLGPAPTANPSANAPFVTVDEAQPQAGLPEPSVVIGDLAVLMTMGERGPRGLDPTTREAIRQRDPAMFERLLTQGAFDPDNDQIPHAIQAELARVQCYSGRVDGDWGAGSQAALGRFVEAGGPANLSGQAPGLDLFRALAQSNGIVCPDRAPTPVAAREAPRNTQPAAPRNTERRDPQPAARRNPPAPPAAQPQAPSQGRRINPGAIGLGVIY